MDAYQITYVEYKKSQRKDGSISSELIHKRLILCKDGVFDRDVKYPHLDIFDCCKTENLNFVGTINLD
jgi:hypothetical protein